ncbi:MAG: hypothetical protein EA385_06835 [Salinarimonadaceae bacterium]|nr:MAG: hypothetical protein EA385_06835 [Salinarimonadaceae bacterium]
MKGSLGWARLGGFSIFCLVILLGFLVAGNRSAEAQERHALVIGVDRYENVPDLLKAGNDARAVAEVLEVVGFRVTLGVDIQRRDYSRLMSEFTRAIAPGDEAIFYFAGHGIEVDGRNYLLPADVPAARPGDEDFVRSESIAVDHVLDMIGRAGARVSMVILDACRDNPFPREGTRSLGGGRGLGRVAPAEGTFVLYSAGINQLALDRLSDDDPDPNSVFTRALLPLLVEPGLPVQGMVRRVRQQVREMAQSVGHIQFPAYYDQLTDDYLIVPASLPGVGDAVPGVDRPVAVDHCTSARADWVVLRDTDSVSALQNYAEAHAQCPIFASLARERLADISVGSCLAMAGNDEDLRSDGRVALSSILGRHMTREFAYLVSLASADLRAVIDACSAAHEINKENAEVAFRLGLALHADKAEDVAHELYELAAKTGHPGAMTQYARTLPGDEAETWSLKAAEAGDIDAMIDLGVWYGRGYVRPFNSFRKDIELSEHWLRKAAEAGSRHAMSFLAKFYENESGPLYNIDEAVNWHRKAAEAGNKISMFDLGFMYMIGNNVAQDIAEGMRWIRKAAERGYPAAMANVGGWYHQGNIITQDFRQAAFWYRKAADAGVTGAQYWLGILYRNGRGVAQNDQEAARWLREAADREDRRAQYVLGRIYLEGAGVAKNERTGVELMIESYKNGLNWLTEALGSGSFDREVVAELQRQLHAEGHYNSSIDGVYGAGTQAALEQIRQ